ncbi:MAG TPA: hypothetical protein VGH19_11305 [Verrucomicrobiae bacterium]
MPDWFYRTVSRPLLFRLPADKAQSLACSFMGMIGDLPQGLGGAFIDFLGHMRPDARLENTLLGRKFIGPVGLGTRLDGTGLAINAWTRFGFSFIELGPLTDTAQEAKNLERDESREALKMSSPATIDAPGLADRLRGKQTSPVHCIVRLRVEKADSASAAKSLLELAGTLKAHTGIFSIEVSTQGTLPGWSAAEWGQLWETLHANAPKHSWLLVVPVTQRLSFPDNIFSGCDGVILDAYQVQGGTQIYSPASKPLLVDAVKQVRGVAGDTLPIIASGGIHQPIDAKEVLGAGATLVQIDTGLIYSGPGLPKRLNEAVLSTLPAAEETAPPRLAKLSWFWTALMGLGMLIGSVLALWIALTRIVMPYDEAFCGISRAQLQLVNERLLPFMSHDRVSLAGTMIAIGLLYMSFSWFGSKRGEHWAKVAVLISAGAGFFSFFLFLGFDYFDPFHGFVTAVLFQLFVQGIVGDLPQRTHSSPPEWTETKEWRRAQWGQLLLVIHSVGLLGAGVIICCVGINDVFVHTDLKFLQTEFITLRDANPRLVPLVAHDRATLGGMLIASGLLYLLGSMWGLRRGANWLWHAFLWSGLAAYVCAIGVHFHVGYVDWHHLLPAFAGMGLLLIGLGLCREWMKKEQ